MRALVFWGSLSTFVVACSAGGGVNLASLPTEGAHDAAPFDEEAADASSARKPDGGRKTDAGKTTEVDAGAAFASDPKNCGAVGHDCRGAMCTAGLCEPEKVATVHRPIALAVAGAQLFMVDYPKSSSTPELFRSGKIPGSSATSVPGPKLYGHFDTLELSVGGDYIYFALLGAGDGALHRRPIGGVDAGSDERISSDVPYEDVKSFNANATHVAFAVANYPSGTWLRTHSGTLVEFPSLTTDPVRRRLDFLSFEGDAVFGLYDGKIYETKLAAPTTANLVFATGAGGFDSAFVATSVAFYGVTFRYSNPVTCASTNFNLWRKPRPGTSASTGGILLAGHGWVPSLRADGKGAVYPLRPCGNGDTPLMAYRETDGAAYALAEFDGATDVFALDDEYVYFSRWDDDALYRVAR